MAKHDQRILKFLNQNADRAPTITEMMTRLNISISDISESLISLQAQGLISKKVNQQGIECWFPGGAGQAVPSGAMSGLNLSDRMPAPAAPPMAQATAQMPAMGGSIAVETRGLAETRSPFHAEAQDRRMSAPEAQPPAPRPLASAEREARPVQVQHVAVAEPPPAPRGLDASDRNGIPSLPQQPVFNGSAGMYGLAPASRGVGFLTLLAGLVAAVALSAFITTRLIAKEFKKASASFVDRKALTEATAGQADAQEKTKAQVAALEAEIKKLTDELAASKASAESSKVAAAPAADKDAAAAAKGGKAAKAEAKAAEAHATAAPAGKPAKGKKALAAAKAKPAGPSAMAKAAARGAAMRKKTPKAAAHESASDEGGSSASSESASSSSSDAPSVPNPPGLDDLPPPPAE